jgi:hypothetical protein
MNERIRELAEQAGYIKDMFGVGHWDMPECKKFAELIIEECLNTCGSYADCYGVSQSIAKQIRSDFGIEEKNT